MLVLTRRLGQSIVIGEEIKIQILHIQRGSVRIGINAPSNVRILRNELKDSTVEFNVPPTDQETISGAKTLAPMRKPRRLGPET